MVSRRCCVGKVKVEGSWSVCNSWREVGVSNESNEDFDVVRRNRRLEWNVGIWNDGIYEERSKIILNGVE